MRHFKVTKVEIGERLDKYLVNRLKGISRHGVKDLIDLGRVKVNGKRVIIAKWEMLDGDNVEVRLAGWEPRGQKQMQKQLPRPEAAFVKPHSSTTKDFIRVIYEDRDVLVVDKPAGAVIQLGEKSKGGPTYVDSLKAYLRRKHKSRGAYIKPVHRLDKETSGLMVFAKSKVGERLVDQFKKHAVERSYLAIVDGAVGKENGRIDIPIKKGHFGHGKRASVGQRGEGSRSLTLYDVKERYEKATLLRLDLKTGRTHQARIHMAAINHPIVGDRIYGRQGGIKFSRHALHSCFLAFSHPGTGERMKFRSGLPKDMEMLVDKLRGD